MQERKRQSSNQGGDECSRQWRRKGEKVAMFVKMRKEVMKAKKRQSRGEGGNAGENE